MSFGNNCPRFTRDFNNLQHLPEIQRFNEDHQNLYNYLKENSGMNLTDLIDDTLTLYDILLVEVTINYLVYKNYSKQIIRIKFNSILLGTHFLINNMLP